MELAGLLQTLMVTVRSYMKSLTICSFFSAVRDEEDVGRDFVSSTANFVTRATPYVHDILDGLLVQFREDFPQSRESAAISDWGELRWHIYRKNCLRHSCSLFVNTSHQPYIMKAYFGMPNPPVKIATFAIGDGTIGSDVLYAYLPTVRSFQTRAHYNPSDSLHTLIVAHDH